jgi:hypothetical protein
MKPVIVECAIAAPPADVFAAATAVEQWTEIIPAIVRVEKLTPGPVGRGTRWRETRRIFGREGTEEMEFLEFEPHRRYLVGAESHGCRYRTEFRFDPRGKGTLVTMSFGAVPLTFGAKVMSVLMGFMRKKMAEMCAADLNSIRVYLERR